MRGKMPNFFRFQLSASGPWTMSKVVLVLGRLVAVRSHPMAAIVGLGLVCAARIIDAVDGACLRALGARMGA